MPDLGFEFRQSGWRVPSFIHCRNILETWNMFLFIFAFLTLSTIPSWCLVNVVNSWMEWKNAFWIQFGWFTWRQQCGYCVQDEVVVFSESCNVKCFWKLALLPIRNFNQVELKPCIRTTSSLVVHEVAVLLWKPWETCFFHSLFSPSSLWCWVVRWVPSENNEDIWLL